MSDKCANITNCKWTYCTDNNQCLLHVLANRKRNIPAPIIVKKNFTYICEIKQKEQSQPCIGCDKSCEYLTKVSKNRIISKKKREKIYQRDQRKCIECGREECNLTIDHLLPISKGGTNDEWNLATMCYDCNTKKGDKIVFKYLLLSNRLKAEQSKNIDASQIK